MFFPFIKGEHVSETRRCFFAFFIFFPCWSGCSCVPSSKADFTSRNRGEETLHGGFEIGRIWWRPKNIPKWWSSPTRIFGKTLVGQRSTVAFDTHNQCRGAIYGFQGAVKTFKHHCFHSDPPIWDTLKSVFRLKQLFTFLIDCLDCPPCVGHFLMITFAHWGGVKMCANRTPGLKWGVGEGVGIASLWGWAADILGISRAPQVSPALELKGGPQDFVAQGRPITRFRTALQSAVRRLWVVQVDREEKKRHQQGSRRCYIQPSENSELVSYHLETCCSLPISWLHEIVGDLSSVIGFPAAICWQTDPMPSQTADSSSYSCAALAQTRTPMSKERMDKTVLRRLFQAILGYNSRLLHEQIAMGHSKFQIKTNQPGILDYFRKA